MDKLKNIRRLTNKELINIIKKYNYEEFRAFQILDWIWNKNILNFNMMSNLPKKLISFLNDKFCFTYPTINNYFKSIDGTIKYSIKLDDDNIIESVLIPEKNRITLCISSQVGCSLNCKFCATSRLGFIRNLFTDEIIDQFSLLNNESKKFYDNYITNIVFMGMGEPLLNYNSVKYAIQLFTSDKYFNRLSSRKITLSTAGIPKMIKKLADDNIKVNLAVSLHSAKNNKRVNIMPFSKNISINNLINSLIYWYNKNKRIITFEYIILNNINDNYSDIEALVNLCKKVPCKVNIIEYNMFDNSDYKQASYEIINNYNYYLNKNNITTNIRRSRGGDISAACGQLANYFNKKYNN